MTNEAKIVHVNAAPVSEASHATQLEKWGAAGKSGFQVVPNVLFRAQSHLDIDAVDVVILLNLSLHWWGKESLPHPSPGIIADRMKVTRRTVERRLDRLEKKGFIKRRAPKALAEGKPKVRKFEMDGLVEKLSNASMTGLSQRSFVKTRRLESGHKITG